MNVIRLAAVLMLGVIGSGCTTAYDAYGNPRPVVEPGVAVLGAAAAGLLAYSLARDHGGRYCAPGYAPYRGYSRGYYARPAYYRPGFRHH
jgi:hypothetical protein